MVTRPAVVSDTVSQGFWEATARGELAIQACRRCDTLQHPPRALCAVCGGDDELAYRTVSGEARLSSWTTMHHKIAPSFADALPYVVALVELVEQDELYLVTDFIGRDVPDLTIGMMMRVSFAEAGSDGVVLPQFVAAGQS